MDSNQNSSIILSKGVYTMNNGNTIPCIGLGTYQNTLKDDVDTAVQAAYKYGYRHIDTAIMYGNESYIGSSLEKNNIPRSEIFITTKIPPEGMEYNKALKMVDQSLQNLKTSYLDLVLIHWPQVSKLQKRIEVWRALEKCVEDGKVRSIGVSNFTKKHLLTILENCKIKPSVNQIEIHPLYRDIETIEFCREQDIILEAYCPFAQFDSKLIANPVLVKISQEVKKTAAQVLVRWSLQHRFVVLPKSCRGKKIEENIQIDDFVLSDDQMKLLDDLNCGYKIDWDPAYVI